MVAKARQEAALAIAFSVGIGLTNEWNLRCAHCYRPDMVVERLTRRVPAACVGCPCRGGCAGRRALTGQAGAADPYCPFARGDQIVLDWERAARQDLPKVGSACTTVVSGL